MAYALVAQTIHHGVAAIHPAYFGCAWHLFPRWHMVIVRSSSGLSRRVTPQDKRQPDNTERIGPTLSPIPPELVVWPNSAGSASGHIGVMHSPKAYQVRLLKLPLCVLIEKRGIIRLAIWRS